MTIKHKKQGGKIQIDLTGPEGNAFFLLGRAKDLSEQLGKNWKDIDDRMTSSDYENLVNVFDEEFGDYVDLYR